MPDIANLVAQQKLSNLGGAGPAAARSWDFAYTWNAGATTFTSMFLNITDTASAAGSLINDWQVGGVSQFKVSKAGNGTFAGTVTATNIPATVGDVVGPASSVDNQLVRYSGTTGKVVDAVTGATLSDTGVMVLPAGSAANPSYSFAAGYGFYFESSVLVGAIAGGSVNLYFGGSSTQVRKPVTFNSGTVANNLLYGNTRQVVASTAGSGAPRVATVDDSFKVLTNEGSTAENYHTLPTAAAGLEYTFIVQDADGLRITAAAGDTIRLSAGVSAAAGFVRSTVIGSTVTLVCINATEWVRTSETGTWTIDV